MKAVSYRGLGCFWTFRSGLLLLRTASPIPLASVWLSSGLFITWTRVASWHTAAYASSIVGKLFPLRKGLR
ncbi:hypothetical protein CASFOL_027259 [Castilleja foliolosa]|uniref:Secreted protein n=1 Tax=Castilleja foliolosa TaxID=1961234 RepID=A0ABD3CEA9_9LAMI